MVIQGASLRIVYAVTKDDRRPARDFYQSLDESDQSKFDSVFLMMAEHGQIRNIEKFRSAGAVKCTLPSGASRTVPLYEFKIHRQRILAFQEGPRWILTHGFPKGNTLATERTRAKTIIDDLLSRGFISGGSHEP